MHKSAVRMCKRPGSGCTHMTGICKNACKDQGPMGEEQQSRLFAELELRDVEETGRELGSGAYGVVTEVNVKGLK